MNEFLHLKELKELVDSLLEKARNSLNETSCTVEQLEQIKELVDITLLDIAWLEEAQLTETLAQKERQFEELIGQLLRVVFFILQNID